MRKQNCWEFKKCGRETGTGADVCPAKKEKRAHGVNGGINGGRVCWAIEGTFCDGGVQGTYAQKLLTCLACDFRQMVQEETGSKFRPIFI